MPTPENASDTYQDQIREISGLKAHGVHTATNDMSHTGSTAYQSDLAEVVFAAGEIEIGDILLVGCFFASDSEEADTIGVGIDDFTTSAQRIYSDAGASTNHWYGPNAVFFDSATTATSMNKYVTNAVGANGVAHNSITTDIVNGLTLQFGCKTVSAGTTITLLGYYVHHIRSRT